MGVFGGKNMKFMEVLNLQEMMAMELKYLRNTHAFISQRIGVPEKTIEKWFGPNGRLNEQYRQYSEDMNLRRRENLAEKLFVSDAEFFITTTNLVRKFNQLLKDGKITPKFSDVRKAWEMQRIMRGLPTSYQKQDTSEVQIEEDQILMGLRLTDEDFEDDKRLATAEKIRLYLAGK